MSQATFQEKLVRALTATTEPESQIAGIPFDADTYEILGEVPMVVRHLHNFSGEIATKADAVNADFQSSEDDSEDEAKLESQLKSMMAQMKLIDKLKWHFLKEAFPETQSDKYTGLAILEGWKVGGTLATEADQLHALFEALLGGSIQARDGGEVRLVIGGGKDGLRAALFGGRTPRA